MIDQNDDASTRLFEALPLPGSTRVLTLNRFHEALILIGSQRVLPGSLPGSLWVKNALRSPTRLPEGATRLPEGATGLSDDATRLPEGATGLSDDATRLPEGATGLSDGATRLPEALPRHSALRGCKHALCGLTGSHRVLPGYPSPYQALIGTTMVALQGCLRPYQALCGCQHAILYEALPGSQMVQPGLRMVLLSCPWHYHAH